MDRLSINYVFKKSRTDKSDWQIINSFRYTEIKIVFFLKLAIFALVHTNFSNFRKVWRSLQYKDLLHIYFH